MRWTISAKTARWVLLAIMALAVVLRVASALYQGNRVEPLPGIFDQLSYDGLARRLVEGHGFSFAEGHWPATPAGAPTAHWSYLYTVYLAVVYAIFGMQPVAARLIQAVLVGILQTWLAWRIGRRVFGPAVGLVSAAFTAVYLYFVYYAGALITETFYITAVMWVFDVAFRLSDAARAGRRVREWPLWVELGIAVGVATLLRQLFLLVAPLLLLWIWWRRTRPAVAGGGADSAGGRWSRLFGWKTLRGFVLAVAITGIMIIPWTVRNYLVFHTLVPLNTNAGYVFYWANHPIYGTSFIGILPADGPSYADLLPPELLNLNEAELDKALLARGIGFVTADPIRYLMLSTSRGREYFKFWPSADSSLVSNISRVGSFGIFLPFMIYGVVLASVRFVRSKDQEWRHHWSLPGVHDTVYLDASADVDADSLSSADRCLPLDLCCLWRHGFVRTDPPRLCSCGGRDATGRSVAHTHVAGAWSCCVQGLVRQCPFPARNAP
ncbi:MAG: glycosyltransferase family 39 protein [Anaerolineales bacterium]|nr:glycosyltransferase family 39 protein [Anaerolineales bacterium]